MRKKMREHRWFCSYCGIEKGVEIHKAGCPYYVNLVSIINSSDKSRDKK